MDSLSKLITQRVAMTDTFPVLELQSDLVGELVKINPEMPVSYLQDLCQKPIVMGNVMKSALSQLEEMLCMEESIYQDAEKRKEIVEAYQSYLDACREQIFYEFDFILMYMAPDEISDILSDARYFSMFSDYFTTIGMSEQYVPRWELHRMDYFYTYVNDWFAGWKDQKLDYVQEQVLDQLKCFLPEGYVWETDENVILEKREDYVASLENLLDSLPELREEIEEEYNKKKESADRES